MKQVDKHFREKLRDLDSDVPADMWDKIAPAIAKESDKTRPLLWFALSGFLLLGTAIGTYLLLFTDSTATSSNPAYLSDAKAEHTQSESTSTLETYTQDVASITEARNVLARYDNTSTSGTSQEASATGAGTNAVQSDAVDATASSTTLGSTTTAAAAETNADAMSAASQTTTSQTNASTSASSVRMIITETYYEGKEKVSNTNKMTLRSGESTSLSISSIERPTIQSVRSLEDGIGIRNIFGPKSPQCPTFLKQRPTFFIDGYISHDVAMKSYAGPRAATALRSETELTQYSFGAGVRLSYYITKSIGVRSGLAFQQINEQFYYDDPDARMIRIVLETDENGVLKEVEREVTGRRIVQNANVYRFVDIPLLAFYEFAPAKSPFYYSVNAGVNVNLLFSQSGQYLSPNETVNSFVGDEEYANPYRTSAGVSLYTSFAMHYVLNNQIDLMVEPHLTAQLNPITRDGAPVSERFAIAGINTGIRYKF